MCFAQKPTRYFFAFGKLLLWSPIFMRFRPPQIISHNCHLRSVRRNNRQKNRLRYVSLPSEHVGTCPVFAERPGGVVTNAYLGHVPTRPSPHPTPVNSTLPPSVGDNGRLMNPGGPVLRVESGGRGTAWMWDGRVGVGGRRRTAKTIAYLL